MLADWRTAGLEPKLHAMCGFIEKLVREPEALGADDIAAVRAAGVTDAGIREATYVCAMFSTIVRLADAFDWDVPPEFEDSKKSLVKFGYKLPPMM